MPRPDAKPVQVLIVDDSPTDRFAFRRHLTRGTDDPCEVTEATTGQAARAQVMQSIPDCVLLDFDLPDCNGLTLVRDLVAAHGTHAFGIVMLTSATNIEVAVEALRCGAHDFLPKNAASVIALRRAVDNAVEKAAIQRELEAQRKVLAEKNRELEVHVKRLESEAAERQRAEAALRKSEQQLRLVADHAVVMLAHCDRDGRYKFVNRAYADRFGLTPQEVIGQHARDIVGGAAYASIQGHVEKVLLGHQVEFEVEVDYALMGRRWVHVVYAPERQADGKVIGFVGVLTDTTQRKRVEQDLEAARDEALAASRAKDDFLAALSHELRTPLNPVLLLASEAAENPDLPREVRAIFEVIRKNVDLEARLIDDLLNLTGISRGKLALDRLNVDVNAIVKDAIANVRADVEQKHISLHYRFSAPRHVVSGDAVRLQQVFWNLLKNAVKFTHPGGGITITTMNPPGSDELQIAIADTGIGMTPEELSRIFEAFSQGEHAGDGGSHRFGGLGLGLAISRMLVESHAGRIQAYSKGRDHGSVFTVRLPLAVISEDEPTTRRQAPRRLASVIRQHEPSSIRILLVEDHEATRTALAQLLARRQYQVTAVGTAGAALAAAREERFDLLISDIGLPDSSGHELMVQLSQHAPVRGIALTGYGMEHDISRSREAGFQAHLTKPIRLEMLERAIAEALSEPTAHGDAKNSEAME